MSSKLSQAILTITVMILSFVISIVTYTVAVGSLLPDEGLPSNHKWFLIKTTPSPLLVVEGGSSSHHGISASALGEVFGLEGINLGDQAGYLLEDKVARLESRLGPGSVLLVTVEWVHLFREQPTDVYLDHMAIHNSDYFHSLPLLLKMRRALNFSVDRVITLAREPDTSEITTQFGRRNHIQGRVLNKNNADGGFAFANSEREPDASTQALSCDAYISKGISANPSLSGSFKRTLGKLSAMQKRGVKVFIAWPPVVGDDCYQVDKFAAFSEILRKEAEKHDLTVIGEFADFKYSDDLMDNTHYHLSIEGRQLHTDKLLSLLRETRQLNENSPRPLKAPINSQAAQQFIAMDKGFAKARIANNPPLPQGVWFNVDRADSDLVKTSVLPYGMISPESPSGVRFIAGRGGITFVQDGSVEKICVAIRFRSTPPTDIALIPESGPKSLPTYSTGRDYYFQIPSAQAGPINSFDFSAGSNLAVRSFKLTSKEECPQ